MFAGWDSQDWFGFAAVLAIIAASLASIWASWITARRAGRQKIAEARLRWSDRYKDLVLDLDAKLSELDRLIDRPRYNITRRRLRLGIRRIATEMLFMTNPDSVDAAAQDEYAMERDLLDRLAYLGMSLDMNFVRKHRLVMKHNWRQAKSEF
ncbi:hypothetical protein [Mesorhizobium sp. M7A.F.Ca.US.010.02.1.1]|uniref:hypothetical protein n=1 Tax=Mesorhizobium sp. M7A.F.Ca.US.010.02.1.1 TaxID=2496743 RepID=UPI000FD2F130|nr:hypothetical protein [Mesorhizobium sp. M7A.F.Ca.US.010.02.1.1]RUW91270.1 hypothetical protein EOA19_16035 [Mesorhizobium sp. M7A.F.Ca.US.010.02.1.1]